MSTAGGAAAAALNSGRSGVAPVPPDQLMTLAGYLIAGWLVLAVAVVACVLVQRMWEKRKLNTEPGGSKLNEQNTEGASGDGATEVPHG